MQSGLSPLSGLIAEVDRLLNYSNGDDIWDAYYKINGTLRVIKRMLNEDTSSIQ